MRVLRYLLALVCIFFVQQWPVVSASGIDLPLIFVVLVSVRTTYEKGAAWGFLLGFLQDLLSAGWVGPNTFAKTLVGFGSSLARRYVYKERITTQTALIAVMAFLHQMVIWMVLIWDRTKPPFFDTLGILSKEVLMTTLIGALVCVFVVKFRRRRYDPATA